MKRFLLPILVAFALPNAVNAEIDKETAEFCLKATDFAGCVETMKRGLDPIRKQNVEDGLRTWTRDTGVIVRMRVDTVEAINPKRSDYGRYLQWRYSRTGEGNMPGSSWRVQGDCDEFTANWDNDGAGWVKVKDISYLLKPGEWRGQSTYEPAREAQSVLKEFCPLMDKLVLEAKERDRLNGIEEAKNKSSSGGIKVNCDSPVWKNKPRCN